MSIVFQASRYLGRHLGHLPIRHYCSIVISKSVLISVGIGLLVPIFIPAFHFGFVSFLWEEFAHKVDKDSCICSCWDTRFKGAYETGIATYKHVYFNLNSNSLRIWILIVVGVVGCYEACKYIAHLYVSEKLRVSMLSLFLMSLYAHYYAWWAYFNYWNDDYYRQWWHQMFFCSTELVSTAVVLNLANSKNPVTVKKLLCIGNIALIHILASGFDQFVENVFKQEGRMHQVLRDVFLMIPDIMHVILPLVELRKLAAEKKMPPTHLISNEEFFGSVAVVCTLWIFCLLL